MKRPHLNRIALALGLWLLANLLVRTAAFPAELAAGPEPEQSELGRLSGGIGAVLLQGSLALVGDDHGLLVLDVSDSERPSRIGQLDLGGGVADIAAVNTLVYVALHGQGLRIVDITDPSAPRLRGKTSLPASALGPSAIDVVDSRAVLSVGNGFQLLDVHNPDAPTLIGGWNDLSAGGMRNARLAGDRVFLVTASGLNIFDVSIPGQVSEIGSYNLLQTYGNTWTVDIVGDLAYLAVSPYGLVILDVSKPHAPREVAALDTPGFPLDVHVADGLAYLATREGGLQLLDVRDPAHPRLLTSLDTPGAAVQVAVSGTLIAVADNYGGMPLFTSAGETVERRGVYGVAGRTTAIASAGDVVYVGNSQALVAVDVSTPAHPQVVGTLELPGDVTAITISGDIAYVGSTRWNEGNGRDDVVWLVSLDDPTAPRIRSSVPFNSAGVRDLLLAGTRLYVATYNLGLQAIDVRNPDAPVLLGRVPNVPSLYINRIRGGGARAYLNTGEVLDLSQPAMPRLIGTLDLLRSTTPTAGSGPTTIRSTEDIEGTTLYLLEQTFVYDSSGWPRTPPETTLLIVDVADLNTPRVLGRYSAGSADKIQIQAATVRDEVAYVATTQGVELVDVSEPTQPYRLGLYGHVSGLNLVLDTGWFIAAADYFCGLHLYPVRADPGTPTVTVIPPSTATVTLTPTSTAIEAATPAPTPTGTPASTPTSPGFGERQYRVMLPLLHR